MQTCRAHVTHTAAVLRIVLRGAMKVVFTIVHNT